MAIRLFSLRYVGHTIDEERKFKNQHPLKPVPQRFLLLSINEKFAYFVRKSLSLKPVLLDYSTVALS